MFGSQRTTEERLLAIPGEQEVADLNAASPTRSTSVVVPSGGAGDYSGDRRRPSPRRQRAATSTRRRAVQVQVERPASGEDCAFDP
jgi:hypothetical protein